MAAFGSFIIASRIKPFMIDIQVCAARWRNERSIFRVAWKISLVGLLYLTVRSKSWRRGNWPNRHFNCGHHHIIHCSHKRVTDFIFETRDYIVTPNSADKIFFNGCGINLSIIYGSEMLRSICKDIVSSFTNLVLNPNFPSVINNGKITQKLFQLPDARFNQFLISLCRSHHFKRMK